MLDDLIFQCNDPERTFSRLYPCLCFAVHRKMHNAKLGAEWFATPFS